MIQYLFVNVVYVFYCVRILCCAYIYNYIYQDMKVKYTYSTLSLANMFTSNLILLYINIEE